MGGIGIFLLLSALLVMIPVALQLRQREIRWADTRGYALFVIGLLVAAAADSRAAGSHRTSLAVAGVILSLAGLLVQIRVQPRND
jgi:hypothetical protein